MIVFEKNSSLRSLKQYELLFITKNSDKPIRNVQNNYYVNIRWFFSRRQ